MVRIGYAHEKFTFPGGGVEKNESFEEAAIRELEEETGIKTQHLIEVGEYTSDRYFRKNIVKCFYFKADSSFVKIDDFEIIEAGWYFQDQLPKDCSFSVPKIMEIYRNFRANN